MIKKCYKFSYSPSTRYFGWYWTSDIPELQLKPARYHIGESMLASIRHFLRFIDLDAEFDSYGFTKKVSSFDLSVQRSSLKFPDRLVQRSN